MGLHRHRCQLRAAVQPAELRRPYAGERHGPDVQHDADRRFPGESVPETLKHEWGHAILSYYEATGTAPLPSVDNHQPAAYVNCRTGEGYLLVDETQDEPIRNSI